MQVGYRGLGQCGGGLRSAPEATGLRWPGTLEEVGKEAANAGQQLRESGCLKWNSRRTGSTHSYCVFD